MSYDFGWQKKSSGKKYDSKSGHGFVIGAYTRKIIDCILLAKSCYKCESEYKKSFSKKSVSQFYEEEEKFIKQYIDKLDNNWKESIENNVPFSIEDTPIEYYSPPYVHELDTQQVVSPSEVMGKLIDNKRKNHICTHNYNGSSGGMEATGLLQIMERMHSNRR